MMDQISLAVNNPGQEGLSLSFKMCPQFGRNYLSLSFVFDCEVPRNPSCTYLQKSKISNDVTLFPPSDQWYFCWPQHFHKHCKEDFCGCFYWLFIGKKKFNHSTLLTGSIVRYCCNGAICHKSLQFINARNLKFASSKISHLSPR